MAQMVTLRQLEKLASRKLQEEEDQAVESSRFFKGFSDVYRETLARQKKSLRDKDDVLKYTHLGVKRSFLEENCPPIEFVGAGSSRVAYALDGGICLKIAISQAGVAQNQNEVHNMVQAPDSRIFPKFFTEIDGCKCIFVECVAPCRSINDSAHLARLIGLRPGSMDDEHDDLFFIVSSILRQMSKNDRDKTFEQAVNTRLENEMEHFPGSFTVDLYEMVLDPKTPAQKSMSEIFRYVFKHHEQLVPGDLAAVENWGFAIRDGKICPVILDAGFSREVSKTYYGF